MEGLGEGYEAFLERLHSDIAVATVSKSSGMTENGSPESAPKPIHATFVSPVPHLQQRHQSKYIGYPSPANAFTVKREESSASSDSSAKNGRAFADSSRDDKVDTSSGITSFPVEHSYRQKGHRRAQSEIAFRLPDDLSFDFEPGFLESDVTDELGDSLLSLHLDVDKVNSSSAPRDLASSRPSSDANHAPGLPAHHARSLSVDQMLAGFEDSSEESWTEHSKPRHSHSNSMDGYASNRKDSNANTWSKTATANNLAEIALIDPKRAKRILANRQSAARSKERKMRYIAELERKVQSLQTEAAALSAQLTLIQNDTALLTAENNDLKFQLQTLEKQSCLSNALNVTLKEELRRLKLATGEMPVGNGQKVNLEINPLLTSFYQTQDSLLGQQLQQLHTLFKSQQVMKH